MRVSAFCLAFGAVCFNVRIGCLEPLIASDSDAFRVIQSVNRMFEAIQKTNFAFPWYAIYRTQLYQQFLDATRTCQRLGTPFQVVQRRSQHRRLYWKLNEEGLDDHRARPMLRNKVTLLRIGSK